MTDYPKIYKEQAALYDAMVDAEDADGAVMQALREIAPALEKAEVVEVGVGTGRITKQLVTAGAFVRGIEIEPAMLTIAQGHLVRLGADASALTLGSLDSLPWPDASADLGVAGWVFGHQRSFEPDRWRATVSRGVAELERVVRPGGKVVLFETLGTAVEAPGVREDLAELQRFLEHPLGFERRVIRTDYVFPTAARAAEALEFFFGSAVARRVRDRNWARVPEWTGCWSKAVNASCST